MMQKIYDLTIITRKLDAQFKNWANDNSGVAAVEFALIAVPFFILLFGLIEISLIFIVTTTLEHGLTEASRQIRTGAFQQNPSSTAATFKQDICDELFNLLDCPGGLVLDVTTFSSFVGTSQPSRIDSSGNFDNSNQQFTTGSRNDIVLIRAFYEWELITPVLSAPLSNLSNGNRLIEAGIAFRNEPFS